LDVIFKKEDAMSGLEKLRVLIVEDQMDMRSIIRNMLTEMGMTQIFEATDGREALTFTDMAQDMIDVIICDWNLPKLAGIDVLKQLRSVNPDLPFLMLTGRGDLQSVTEARASGVTAYIRKPFSPAQLEVKLRVIQQKMSLQ
jgi:two-component system, chemotaxis family, chemotaxis protein CheY